MGLPDRYTLGKSRISPYKEGESYAKRHKRRLQTNLTKSDVLKRYCQTNNIAWEITNNGNHWAFHKERTVIEWWPSTAKAVINKKWMEGIHVHDIWQCIEILRRTYRIIGAKAKNV